VRKPVAQKGCGTLVGNHATSRLQSFVATDVAFCSAPQGWLGAEHLFVKESGGWFESVLPLASCGEILVTRQLNRNSVARWIQERAADSWLIRRIENLNRHRLDADMTRSLTLQHVDDPRDVDTSAILGQHLSRMWITLS
jgi:hypothetical protein